MEILWDEAKNSWLMINRSISFEEIADMIINGKYLAILDNPTREEQLYFVVTIHDYTWIVPFVIDEKERIVLKTAFPSRKYHKIYGGEQDG